MSNLQSLIQANRAALLARERAVSAEMARYYNTIWQRAYLRLDELLGKMKAAQDGGADIKVSWLYEADRLQHLLPQISADFNQFAASATIEARNLAVSAFSVGAQDAQSLLSRAFSNDAGVVLTFNRVPHDAVVDLAGAFKEGSPVSDLFAGFGAQAADLTKNALISGVALGKNPLIIAKDVQEALSIPLSRAIVIARNESLRAYRSAALDSYQRNSDVVDSWQWSCAFSDRTCGMCLAMDGSIHSLDEDMASHVLCRCAMVPVTKTWRALGYDIDEPEPARNQNGAEWFDGLNADQQDSILGKKAGAAYRNGDVNLQDFVGTKDDPQWGKSRYQKSLKEALA